MTEYADFETTCSSKSLPELRVMKGQQSVYNRDKLKVIDKHIAIRETEEKVAQDELARRAVVASERQATMAHRAFWVSIIAIIISLVALWFSANK